MAFEKPKFDIAERSQGETAKQENTIVVRDLDFFYGSSQALHKITLDIRNREVMAFIGPSGCGKSTFLRTLNRMNDTIAGTRVEGTVLIDDVDIQKS